MRKVIAASLACLAISSSNVHAGLDGFYASLRIGLQYSDNGDGADADSSIENYLSRLGYKTETELENGLTGFGQLEFGIDAEDNDSPDDSTRIRLGYAGLKGDFGKLYIGQAYHTFYNYTVAPIDIPWWNASYGLVDAPFRTSDGLTYQYGVGGFSIGATGYFDTDDSEDGYEVGASYDFGPVKMALGYRDIDSAADATTALAVSGKAGPLGYAFVYQDQDENNGLEATLTLSDFYLQLGQLDIDGSDKVDSTTLGYTMSLGKKTLVWFELFRRDFNDGTDEDLQAIATLKYDIF